MAKRPIEHGFLRFLSKYAFRGLENIELAQNFKYYEKLLFQFCSKHIDENGLLCIVPKKIGGCTQQSYSCKKRCGYDIYMYDTVYNSFAMSMLLIASIIKENVLPKPQEEFLFGNHNLKNSGFFIIKKKKSGISTGFNMKGHNSCGHYLFDPRLSGLSPLFIKFNDNDFLPSIPFCPEPYHPNYEEPLFNKVVRIIKNVKTEFRSWSYIENNNPLHAGFLPYLRNTNNIFFPIYINKYKILHYDAHISVIKAKGKFIQVAQSGFFPMLIFMIKFLSSNIGTGISKNELALKSSDFSFDRTIIIHNSFIHFHDKLLSLNSSIKTGFTIRTYSNWICKDLEDKFMFNSNGCGFMLKKNDGEKIQIMSRLCSSKGETLLWATDDKKSLTKCQQVTRKMDHTFIPFDKNNTIENGISVFNKFSDKPFFHNFMEDDRLWPQLEK